jgi:uncharacterized protein
VSSLLPPSQPITLYIDADACPVKQEIYRVAERHARKGICLKVFVVSNSPIAVPRDEMIERVVVGGGMDEADNWIAERAGSGDIVITADVPLASRCVKAGAEVIAPNGKPFTKDSIGMTLATRNLMDSLRSAGEITGGPRPFSPRDRSSFLAALDQAIVRLTRAGFGRRVNALGYCFCEPASEAKCRGPFAFAYRPGRFFYGIGPEPGNAGKV